MKQHLTVRARMHYHAKLSLGRQVALRALAAFLATLAVLRVITAIIHYRIAPFHDLVLGSGLHIHHLFWGILLLMIVGLVALATPAPRWHLRIAVVYGVALGLTLDEFALWLRLADVYWDPVGRESLEASAVAAAVLAMYGAGWPWLHAIVGDVFSGRPSAKR
jgi:hypothetical protein